MRDDVLGWRVVAPLHREMARAAAPLFLGGAGLVLVHLVTLPQDYTAREWVVAAIVGALAAGLFNLWAADHLQLPIWCHVANASLGAALITIVALAGGPQRTAVYGVLYVLVSFYGFCYLGPGLSWGLVLLIGIGFAAVLTVHDVEDAIGQWAVVVGTSAIVGRVLGPIGWRVRELLATEQARTQQLEELDEWKTTFLQAVAHDLRSPLATISGLVATVRDRDLELAPEQRRQLLDRAVAGSERLERLVGDLLDVQRIETGAVNPVVESTRLDELVRASVEAADLGGRTVELDLDQVTAPVEPAKIDRIVTNLVRNAVTHTSDGVTVRVQLRDEGHRVVLVVEDEGEGIHDAVRDGLFDAFRHGGQKDGSTGLGLYLVRRFTELHGGEVEATDRPGGGARFVVRLPSPKRLASSEQQ